MSLDLDDKRLELPSILQRIENHPYLSDLKKDRIKAIKTELWFLKVSLSLKGEKNRRPREDVQEKHKDLMESLEEDLHRLYFHMLRENKVPPDFDSVTSDVLTKIWQCKTEIREYYRYRVISDTCPLIPQMVMDFIDNVVKNIEDLYSARLPEDSDIEEEYQIELFEVQYQIELVQKELCILHNFVRFLGKVCSSEPPVAWKRFLQHVRDVATRAAMVSFLHLPDPDEKYPTLEITDLLSKLRQEKIKPIQPQSCKIYTDALRAIGICNSSPVSSTEAVPGFIESIQHVLSELRRFCPLTDDQTKSFTELFNSLRAILNEFAMINNIEDKMRADLFDLLGTVVIDAAIVVFSFYGSSKGTEDRDQQILVLADKIQSVKTKIYAEIRKWVRSCLPTCEALSNFKILLDSLKELLHSHSDSLDSLKNQLQMVHEELEYFQPFLKGIEGQRSNKHDLHQHLAAGVIAKAYEAEYIVGSFLDKDFPLSFLVVWLAEMLKDIKDVKEELIKLGKNNMIAVATPALVSTQLASTPMNKEEPVGFKDVREDLRVELIDGPPQLDVISIVGMTGIGKTTLARSLYDDKSIAGHFNFQAECFVSQEYTRRGLLLSILTKAIDEAIDLSKEDDSNLAARLKQTLMSKGRYLLVIDNVWEEEAWNGLLPCFPDTGTGSRIILTTTDLKVANHANHVTDPHNLRFLNDGESWSLLQRKVFGENKCPEKLKNVGQEIANRCKGVPLSIVVAAGLLLDNKTEKSWKQVEERLAESIQGGAKDIVQLSYYNLPNTLKPCFLYFGAFLADQEISIAKLISLWIAEGFIETDKEKALEDIAEQYLEDLIRRNLVMHTKKKSTGNTKACRVHNLLLQFCKEKAEEANFLLWLKRDYKADPPNYHPLNPMQRRLSFYSKRYNFSGWSPSRSHARSIFFREVSENKFASVEGAFNFIRSFKFLGVLDLEFVVVDSFPTILNLLKYFAIRTAEDYIPSSIDKLENLETFIVKGIGGRVFLPDTFWKLLKLRHVRVSNKALFTLRGTQEFLDGSPSKLENLLVLSTPYFSCAEDMERIVKKTPNLRKIRCIFDDSWGWGMNEDRFPTLKYLSQLETLKVLFIGIQKISPSSLNFPTSLKKLTLCNFPLPCAEISTIANHSTLEVLKLQQVCFMSREWKVTDKEFPRLKFLKLVNPVLSEWTVLGKAFPCLEQMILHRCLDLEAIPPHFESHKKLQYIEVKSCKETVAISAKDIKDTQVEMLQRSDFTILIQK